MRLQPHPLKPRRAAGKRQAGGAGKKTEKEDKKIFCGSLGRRPTGRRPQNQTARITPFSDRR
jgi:hypothetical protein